MARKDKATGGVPETVRRAVARTIQSTLGPATLTRERAQELADEVLRRAEGSAARAGRGVREAGQRPREAAAEVGDRLRDALTELRTGASEIDALRADVEKLRRRVEALERGQQRASGSARSGPTKTAKPSQRSQR